MFLALAIASIAPASGLDLARAVPWRLDNGLTVVALEEHAAPVVNGAMFTVEAGDGD